MPVKYPAACDENELNPEFDIGFIAAGLSTAMTLIHNLTKSWEPTIPADALEQCLRE